MKNTLKKLLFVSILALLPMLPLLTMCSKGASKEETVATNVVGYNHTDRSIDFSVRSLNSQAGAYVDAHHGGGVVCCVSFPKPWHPGYQVTVSWTHDYAEGYQERVVSVPEYDARDTGEMDVHFLRNGDIKVIIPSGGGPGSPNYPLKGPEMDL